MTDIKKDHILETGGGAAIGGIAGAAIGVLVGGPLGAAVGAAAGTALGANLGSRMGDAVDDDSLGLGHFQQSYQTMPYYVADTTWDDYAPAYRHGLLGYRRTPGGAFEQAVDRLEQGWSAVRGTSQLDWGQARPAVKHAWTSMRDAEQAATGQAPR